MCIVQYLREGEEILGILLLPPVLDDAPHGRLDRSTILATSTYLQVHDSLPAMGEENDIEDRNTAIFNTGHYVGYCSPYAHANGLRTTFSESKRSRKEQLKRDSQSRQQIDLVYGMSKLIFAAGFDELNGHSNLTSLGCAETADPPGGPWDAW